MEVMLDGVPIDVPAQTAHGQAAFNHTHFGQTTLGLPTAAVPRKFQLPQLNLSLNQSIQLDAPTLINSSQSVLNSQHVKHIP